METKALAPAKCWKGKKLRVIEGDRGVIGQSAMKTVITTQTKVKQAGGNKVKQPRYSCKDQRKPTRACSSEELTQRRENHTLCNRRTGREWRSVVGEGGMVAAT